MDDLKEIITYEEYLNTDLTNFEFSIRVQHCLKNSGINTIADLLRMTEYDLLQIKNLGRRSLLELKAFKKNIKNESDFPKIFQKGMNSFLNKYYNDFLNFNFNKIAEKNLSKNEKEYLKKVKNCYEIIGQDLFGFCMSNSKNTNYIMDMFQNIIENEDQNAKIKECFCKILPQIKKLKLIDLLNIFHGCVENEEIYNFFSKENIGFTLEYFVENDLFDLKKIPGIYSFLQWVSFDLNELYDEFSTIVDDKISEKSLFIITQRANECTFEEIGQQLNLSRERIRQIEAKTYHHIHHPQIRRRLYYLCVKIVLFNGGERNVSVEVLKSIFKEKTDIFLALLKFDSFFLNTFFYQNEKIVLFGEFFYDPVIKEILDHENDILNDISPLLDKIKKERIPVEYFLEKFNNEYIYTGTFYHKKSFHLSQKFIISDIMEKYYPNGIYVYDDIKLNEFREKVYSEFGQNVSVAQNNHALASSIMRCGVLCDSGCYKLSYEGCISKKLLNKIEKYIDSNKQVAFYMDNIYQIFYEELISEGIDNKFFFYGLLKKNFSNKYFFKKTILSKDSDAITFKDAICGYINNIPTIFTKDDIKRAFPGFQNFKIDIAIAQSDVLNFFGSYISPKNLKFYEGEVNSIKNILNELLQDKQVHHSKEIFEILKKRKSEILLRNSIFIPFSIYSVLEFLFKNEFQFKRPYVALQDVIIDKAQDQLNEFIYSHDEECFIDVILEYANRLRFNINDKLVFFNQLNNKFFIYSHEKLVSFEKFGITEKVAEDLEQVILNQFKHTIAIRDITCSFQFPKINGVWSEWLVYSTLKKWGKKLRVAVSNKYFRYALPLIYMDEENLDEDINKISSRTYQKGNFCFEKIAEDFDDLDLEDLYKEIDSWG